MRRILGVKLEAPKSASWNYFKKMIKFKPLIKWSGSKRSQSEEIIKYFPKDIDTYYEPFVGGGSVLMALMLNPYNINVKRYVCSDLNSDLIALWNAVVDTPKQVADHYENLWQEMNGDETNGVSYKKSFYEKIRDRFNKERNPLDFMFVDRTCFNGLIRYNADGNFNTPYHLNRNGIKPNALRKIISDWSSLLKNNGVEFLCQPYSDIRPNANDFAYFDPPYANTKGMYSGGFDNSAFFKWMEVLKCKFVLSYDGISGKNDKTYDVPTDIYERHVYVKSGNSSFKRIKETDKGAIVYESLYIR